MKYKIWPNRWYNGHIMNWGLFDRQGFLIKIGTFDECVQAMDKHVLKIHLSATYGKVRNGVG